MKEPTQEEIVARAEQLASAEGLDWFTMFRRTDERSGQATIGEAQKDELLTLAREQLLAQRTSPSTEA